MSLIRFFRYTKYQFLGIIPIVYVSTFKLIYKYFKNIYLSESWLINIFLNNAYCNNHHSICEKINKLETRRDVASISFIKWIISLYVHNLKKNYNNISCRKCILKECQQALFSEIIFFIWYTNSFHKIHKKLNIFRARRLNFNRS